MAHQFEGKFLILNSMLGLLINVLTEDILYGLLLLQSCVDVRIKVLERLGAVLEKFVLLFLCFLNVKTCRLSKNVLIPLMPPPFWLPLDPERVMVYILERKKNHGLTF